MAAAELLGAQIGIREFGLGDAAVEIQKKVVALELAINATGFESDDTDEKIVARANQFLAFIG